MKRPFSFTFMCSLGIFEAQLNMPGAGLVENACNHPATCYRKHLNLLQWVAVPAQGPRYATKDTQGSGEASCMMHMRRSVQNVCWYSWRAGSGKDSQR